MYILLDIDGVMVPACSWKTPEFLNDGFPAFSFQATKALQKIISETGADILLTTSHKSRYSIPEWYDIFKLRGILVNSISSFPENTTHLSRLEEIMRWYEHKIAYRFVIIDDDKQLNALVPELKSKLVLTSSIIGLTHDLAAKAIEILENESLFI